MPMRPWRGRWLLGQPRPTVTRGAAPSPVNVQVQLQDYGAGNDDITFAQLVSPAIADQAAAVDSLSVVHLPVSAPTPGTAASIASPAFIRSQMPRMHLQNLVTGDWMDRDVQGISSPVVTWMLNGADTFTCTLGPPRRGLLDSTGNPAMREWQTACYLEESGEIRFGGIQTGSTMSGPALGLTFTGFASYANGMPYEGEVYKKTNIDAADVVRYLWGWLQSQPNGNLGLEIDTQQTGVLLGAQINGTPVKTTLYGDAHVGDQLIRVHSLNGLTVKMNLIIGDDQEPAQIARLGPGGTSGPSSKIFLIYLTKPLTHFHADQKPVIQVIAPTAFELDWWNSTDIGQEIQSIQSEAIFDWRETHSWGDPGHNTVRHRLLFNVPRAGRRRDDLRFCEGENIVEAGQVTRDGTAFANTVVGLGAGQGKAMIRSEVAELNDQLRRVAIYQDQTIKTVARMSSRARRQLAAVHNIDTPSSILVKNHRNAPFGSFRPGDDILVRLASGWRHASIWCRIVQMSQDPTTNQMTLSLARSDSFTYLAQSGQAGSA